MINLNKKKNVLTPNFWTVVYVSLFEYMPLCFRTLYFSLFWCLTSVSSCLQEAGPLRASSSDGLWIPDCYGLWRPAPCPAGSRQLGPQLHDPLLQWWVMGPVSAWTLALLALLTGPKSQSYVNTLLALQSKLFKSTRAVVFFFFSRRIRVRGMLVYHFCLPFSVRILL